MCASPQESKFRKNCGVNVDVDRGAVLEFEHSAMFCTLHFFCSCLGVPDTARAAHVIVMTGRLITHAQSGPNWSLRQNSSLSLH